MLNKIISGGQTGADRAALDAALETGFPCGGYCPKDRMAEDGPIDVRYPLIEIKGGYSQRTRKNVVESDGTVIFYEGRPSGGTEQTLLFCIRTGKPYKLIDIEAMLTDHASQMILQFITQHRLSVINIAGPRASNCPVMYDFVKKTIGRIVQPSASESNPG